MAPASRSIFIQTYPATKSLAESKLILKGLQKFGRVSVFRNMQYDTLNKVHHATSNTILAVFETPSAAEAAVNSSPLNIPIPRNLSQPTDPLHPWQKTEKAYQATFPPDIRCTIDWSRHNHARTQTRNPYYSYFQPDQKSFHFHDLHYSTECPVRALADGIVARRDRSGVPVGRMRAIDASNAGIGAKSLWGLYKTGLEEAEGKEVPSAETRDVSER